VSSDIRLGRADPDATPRPRDSPERAPCDAPSPRHTGVELCRGLWQVAGGGVSHDWDASAYVVVGERPLLIDCGSPFGAPQVIANVEALTMGPLTVVLTHGHWDHAGGAREVIERTGALLLVHEGDAETIRTGDPVRTTAALLYDEPFPPVQAHHFLHEGDLFSTGLATVDVLHTPGHTPGSTCFLVDNGDQRVLIAGDTLWGGFHPEIGSDLDSWRSSLARLGALDVDALTFGHGRPRLLNHAHERLLEAGQRFGHFFDPWHKPNYKSFRW
jgi:glyoxylase-like metal-dependent hydrolase (beta-lactamase superfamily II)